MHISKAFFKDNGVCQKSLSFLAVSCFLTLSEAAATCLYISSIWKVRKCDCVYNS